MRPCHANGACAKKITLLMRPRVKAPRTLPSTLPTQPESAVPPSTTAVIDDNVSPAPISGSPDAVSPTSASPENAANNPLMT